MRFTFSTLITASIILSGLSLVQPARVLADDAPAVTKAQGAESAETRIKELHDKLKVTSAQEDLWNKVAKEMRDSAKSARSLAGDRVEKSSTMTAIDDLKSYAEIAKHHADRMARFVDVFTPLYTAMSDDQKKNADEMFRGHRDARAKKHQAALKQ